MTDAVTAAHQELKMKSHSEEKQERLCRASEASMQTTRVHGINELLPFDEYHRHQSLERFATLGDARMQRMSFDFIRGMVDAKRGESRENWDTAALASPALLPQRAPPRDPQAVNYQVVGGRRHWM